MLGIQPAKASTSVKLTPVKQLNVQKNNTDGSFLDVNTDPDIFDIYYRNDSVKNKNYGSMTFSGVDTTKSITSAILKLQVVNNNDGKESKLRIDLGSNSAELTSGFPALVETMGREVAVPKHEEPRLYQIDVKDYLESLSPSERANPIFIMSSDSSNMTVVKSGNTVGREYDPYLEITYGAESNSAPTDIALSSSSVEENKPVGTAVGMLSAIDPDAGDSFTYSLVAGTGDTDNSSFTITGTQLKTAQSFDYETKSSYSIRVRVTDSTGNPFEKALTINVTDVNEHTGPTIVSLSPVNNASGVPISSNLTMTFNEAVTTASGNIYIVRNSDDAIVQTIAASSPSIVSNGTIVTIDLPTDLASGMAYHVKMDAGAFKNAAQQDFQGIADAMTWGFTTVTQSANADLSGLTLSQGILSPAFALGMMSYNASVPNSVTGITVTPTAADNKSKIQINGATVTNGQASSNISLNPGLNTITIVVTAENGNKKTYILVIERAIAATIEPAPTVPTNIVTVEDTRSGNILIIGGLDTKFFIVSGITGGKLYKANGPIEIMNGDFITTAEGSAGLQFMPNLDANGTTGFGFNVQAARDNAGAGLSSATLVQIKVTEVNDAPIAVNDTLSDLDETETVKTIPFSDLLANDLPGPPNELGQILTITKVESTFGGTAEILGNNIKFTRTPGYIGTASFKYTVTDNGTTNDFLESKSSQATATFQVLKKVDKPTVTPAITDEDRQSTSGLVINPTNTGDPATTHFKISNIKNGKLYLNDGTTQIAEGSFITVAQGTAGLKFTPDANLFTTATTTFGFDVQAAPGTDGRLLSDVVSAIITVNFVNDAPTIAIPISNPQVIVGKSNSIDVSNTFSDVDGDTLTLTVESHASNVASVQLNQQQLTIQGLAVGTADITVIAIDNHGVMVTDTFTVFITNTNPVFPSPTITETVEAGKTVSGAVVATDVDGHVLTYSNVTSPSFGSLNVIDDGTWTYTNSLGSGRNDSFKIQVSDSYGGTAEITVNITVKVSSYTVSFDVDGGSVVASQAIADGGKVTTPTTPTKAGYTFGGWYTSSAYTTPFDFDKGITANTVVYAKWIAIPIPVSHTVSFDVDAGSAVASQTIADGEKATLPTPPTKAGHMFGGWYTSNAYTTVFDFNSTITANTVVYAKWIKIPIPISHTVSFNVDGGSAVAPQTIVDGGKVTAPATPTKAGYTFGGWYKETSFATEWNFATNIVDANTTLYARWIRNFTPPTDSEAVAKAKATLIIGYSTGDSATSITQKLTLPVMGEEGTTVSWTSSNPTVVTENGVVQRPSVGDSTVILTATIVKGNVKETKQFIVVVKGYNDRYPSVTSTPDSPPSNTEQIVVDVMSGSGGVVSTATIKRTKNADGTFNDVVTLTEQSARDVVAKLKENGANNARIIIPDQQDKVNEVYISIPKNVMAILKDGKVNVEMVIHNVRITIPVSSFELLMDDMYFRVVPMKAQVGQSEILERAKKEARTIEGVDSTVIHILGRPMKIETNLQNRPVELTLPLPTDVTKEQLNHLAIYIEHSDGTKEMVSGKIVTLADGKWGIQFTVQKFSTFTVLYMSKKEVVEEEVPEEILPEEAQNPYIQGYTDGTFRPNTHITRAQMAVMLARNLSDNDMPASSKVSYSDTAASWSKDEIEYVRAQGIMNGRADGKFGPNEAITRAQMAAIAMRWIDKQCGLDDTAAYCTRDKATITFNDVNSQHWAATYIEEISALGIMTGMYASTFNPEGTLTRAEAVKVLNRLFERELVTNEVPLFSDVPSNHWAFDEIQAAAKK